MASPREKYSNSASTTTRASASATHAVEQNTTRPTTNGIRTAAVATRFQVIGRKSPGGLATPSHHIGGRKSRRRGHQGRKQARTRKLIVPPPAQAFPRPVRSLLPGCRRSAARVSETHQRTPAAGRD